MSFSSEWQLRLCSFSAFNLKTSRFFISHSPRFFNPRLSVWTFDIGNTIPCLNIYREIFIYSMHTCTVRFKYLCFFEASVCVFKLLFDWKRLYGWPAGVLRRTAVCDWRFENPCGSHLSSDSLTLSVNLWSEWQTICDLVKVRTIVALCEVGL